MPFTYKKIISILSLKHAVDEQNLTAFRGRLQHMQRLKFPAGVNTGKGRPTPYGWRELFLLGLAFECLELGSTPDRSVAEITKLEGQLLEALADVIFLDSRMDDPGKVRCLLYMDLSALVPLKSAHNRQRKFAILSPWESSQLFLGGFNSRVKSPYAIIDLRQFVDELASQVADVCEMGKADILEDMTGWLTPSAQADKVMADAV